MRGQQIYVKLHVLNFWLSQDFAKDFDLTKDVSHLCHEPSCVKLTHLNHESHSVNINRKKCLKSLECTGHDPHPECILWDCCLVCTVLNSLQVWDTYQSLYFSPLASYADACLAERLYESGCSPFVCFCRHDAIPSVCLQYICKNHSFAIKFPLWRSCRLVCDKVNSQTMV